MKAVQRLKRRYLINRSWGDSRFEAFSFAIRGRSFSYFYEDQDWFEDQVMSVEEIVQWIVENGLSPDQVPPFETLVKQGFPKEGQVGF